MKALAAEATVSADSMSAVSLLAARLLRNLSDTVVKDIAVTTVINMLRSARRRREFVYYCGVIGLCTPCTRAPPL